MNLEIDHIVLCVFDLTVSADAMERTHGLVSLEGGRHSGHGTANRIVPLGEAYLELVAVADAEEAMTSPFGRWVAANAQSEPRGQALCLRTDDITAVCQSLGLEPVAMSRLRPDGSELNWRLAGLEAAIGEGLPFFIQWDIEPADHPGRAEQGRLIAANQIRVTVSGDVPRLSSWAGRVDGLHFVSGPPGIDSVEVRLGSSTISL